MKTFKKVLILMMAFVMTFAMAACGADGAQSDMEYVKEKGTLVVITEYEPMY